MNKLFLTLVAAVSVSAISARDYVKQLTFTNKTGFVLDVENMSFKRGGKLGKGVHGTHTLSDFTLNPEEQITFTIEDNSFTLVSGNKVRLQNVKVTYNDKTVAIEFADKKIEFNKDAAREIIIEMGVNNELVFFVVDQDGSKEKIGVEKTTVLIEKNVLAVAAAQAV